MYFCLSSHAWWATRTAETEGQLDSFQSRKFFASRKYGAQLSRVLVLLVCHAPGWWVFMGGPPRMSRKTGTLYMEVLLDYELMMAGDDDVRRRYIAGRLRLELTKTLHKYRLKEFDTGRFLADFNRWLDAAVWLAGLTDINDDGPITPMIATRFLITHQPLVLDVSVSEYDRDLYADIVEWVAEAKDPAIVPWMLGSFGEGELGGLYEKAMQALCAFESPELVGPVRDALLSTLESVRYWAVRLCLAKPMPELSAGLAKIASADPSSEIRELAKSATWFAGSG